MPVIHFISLSFLYSQNYFYVYEQINIFSSVGSFILLYATTSFHYCRFDFIFVFVFVHLIHEMNGITADIYLCG